MRAFREAVQLIVKMWTEDTPTFEGEYYHIRGPINEPKGIQKPYPSLWLGGGGEQVTLKLVAKYANACNVGGGNPDVIRQKLGVLREHCTTLGRNYDEIIKSTSMDVVLLEDETDPEEATAQIRAMTGWTLAQLQERFVVGTAPQVAARVQAAVDAGANYIISYFPRIAYDHAPLHGFAQRVIPQIKG
jgi:alkanesulfonate monooxygenase SsuD/methylene tetrahydromethanopterin reductase-like flavin-dependent oxidoreductase (luciferase family)